MGIRGAAAPVVDGGGQRRLFDDGVWPSEGDGAGHRVVLDVQQVVGQTCVRPTGRCPVVIGGVRLRLTGQQLTHYSSGAQPGQVRRAQVRPPACPKGNKGEVRP